jgi:hypothetical protein
MGNPVVDPNAPNPLAAQWEAAGQDPLVQHAERGVARPGYVAPEGSASNPGAGANQPGGATLDVAPRVDPMAQVVDPGSAGGFAPFSETESSNSQTTERVEDPADALGRVDDAYDQDARAQHLRDSMKYAATRDALDSEDDARLAQQQQLEEQLAQAEAEKRQQEKVYQAIEATPIDEDAFWSESPGRTAGAWIALALSGFLQGATRGQNPALNQMVQALNHAQDRYLQNQQKSRESQLRVRERMIGDRATAVASMKLQLSGIVEKRIQLDAQREGLPPPPGLATYLADGAVKRAEAKTVIGQQTVRVASEQRQRELRATPGTGPLRRGDVVLKNLLGTDYQKKHQDAMDPKGLNLGGLVQGADRLQALEQALSRIAQEYDGSLPSQETVSFSKLGLAPLAARLGLDRGTAEVKVKQLLEEAKLAYKQTVNIKSIDSENEGKNFNAIMDSGEGATTLEAIRARADVANQSAISVASGVTRDTQGYIDFVRQTQNAVPGVTRSAGAIPEKRDTGFRAPGKGPDEAETVQQAGPGGAAPGPLPAGASLPAARALATSTTGSRPGTYQRLRGSKPVVPR